MGVAKNVSHKILIPKNSTKKGIVHKYSLKIDALKKELNEFLTADVSKTSNTIPFPSPEPSLPYINYFSILIYCH